LSNKIILTNLLEWRDESSSISSHPQFEITSKKNGKKKGEIHGVYVEEN
jgi:hypothetical protein